jgi:hypothetical protein
MRFVRCAIVVAALLPAGACAGGYDTQTALRNAVDEFHDGFRWGAMGSMLPHVRPADRDGFVAAYENALHDVNMADYQVDRIQIADENDSALVWVSLAWYSNRQMILEEAVVRERWVKDGDGWNRVEVTVERGTLPPGLVPEPESEPDAPAP